MKARHVVALVAGVCLALAASTSPAQSGSVWGCPHERRPLTLADASWTYQQVLEPKQLIKLNDLLTVVVREKSRMSTEGQVDRRKKAEGALALNDWIALDGFSVVPAPQTNGDPKASGVVDNKYRAQANLQERDMLEFNIACVVADIRPNGTMIVEGHRKIQVNEEEWEYSLSGIVRPEDIMPNNTVQSEKIADLRILKRQAGHGRDGVRRGWLLKWLDTYQPF